MAHGARAFSCVRYNEDGDFWELYCADCDKRKQGQTFHPLDHAWWDARNMSACRECLRLNKAAWIKTKRATDPVFKAQQAAASAANRNAKRAIYNRNLRARRKGKTTWLSPLPYRPRPRPIPVVRKLVDPAATPTTSHSAPA